MHGLSSALVRGRGRVWVRVWVRVRVRVGARVRARVRVSSMSAHVATSAAATPETKTARTRGGAWRKDWGWEWG